VAKDAGANKAKKKFDRKRANILNAAIQVFTELGLKGARIADVAASVGLATTSVTYYFKRKEDLATACFLQTIGEFTQLARQAAGATPEERLRSFLQAYFALHASIRAGEHPPLMLFNEIRALDEAAAGEVFRAYVDMFREIRALLQEGSPLPDPPDRDRLNARALLLLAHILWVPVWIDRYSTADYARVTGHLADLFIHGILPTGESWQEPQLQVRDIASDSASTFLRAASEMINDRGYRGASVDSIAESLDLTKGSFYHHYESKEELVYACFERTFAIIEEVMAESSGCADGVSRLKHIVANLVRLQLDGSGPLLTVGTISTLAMEQRGEILGRYRALTHRLADILIDGIIEGSVRPVDPLLAAEMIVQTVNTAHELPRWVRGADGNSAADLLARPLFEGSLG
jgi:AcrR family transcriptional regulator